MSSFGTFRAVARLSQGATAVVCLVQDAAREVTGVGKRLVPRFASDDEARARLRREARVLDLLDGRGAPRLLAQGEDEGGPWLVMEHVAMPTLGSYLTRPHQERVRWVTQGVGGLFQQLAAVHDARDAKGALEVVHADVSPDNVLALDDAGDARFVDFGHATFRDAPGSPSSSFRGTLLYTAPEVARGEAATQASDLFSLALSLLHLAHPGAGAAPPRGGASPATLVVVAGEVPVTAYAEEAARALPVEVARALLAAVAFDPAARPGSAREAWRRGSW